MLYFFFWLFQMAVQFSQTVYWPYHIISFSNWFEMPFLLHTSFPCLCIFDLFPNFVICSIDLLICLPHCFVMFLTSKRADSSQRSSFLRDTMLIFNSYFAMWTVESTCNLYNNLNRFFKMYPRSIIFLKIGSVSNHIA